MRDCLENQLHYARRYWMSQKFLIWIRLSWITAQFRKFNKHILFFRKLINNIIINNNIEIVDMNTKCLYNACRIKAVFFQYDMNKILSSTLHEIDNLIIFRHLILCLQSLNVEISNYHSIKSMFIFLTELEYLLNFIEIFMKNTYMISKSIHSSDIFENW